jgi:ABC-type spermidine/putrescine transport system permease subunit I
LSNPASATIDSPQLRDPAWIKRVFWLLAAAVLLVPALVLTEFKPWTLFEPATIKSTKRFVGDFFPPKIETEFLLMVMREAWRTVAIATTGMALALIIAIPLTFISYCVQAYAWQCGARPSTKYAQQRCNTPMNPSCSWVDVKTTNAHQWFVTG